MVICKKKVKVGIEKFIERFKRRGERLGMKLKVLERKDSKSKYLEELPSFYKYVESIPMIPMQSMLERVFLPWNKIYKEGEDILKFLSAVMPSLEAPSTHLIFFYAFYAKMLKKNFNSPFGVEDVVKMHIGVYTRMMYRKQGKVDLPFDEKEFASPYYDLQQIIESNKFVSFVKDFSSVLI